MSPLWYIIVIPHWPDDAVIKLQTMIQEISPFYPMNVSVARYIEPINNRPITASWLSMSSMYT